MRGNRVPVPDRDALDRRLERRVLERFDLAAVVAHEMVVVVAIGSSRLESGHAVAELDSLDEIELCETVERAVHARDADLDAGVAYALVNLTGREAAVLTVEEPDHLAPRAAGPSVEGTQLREC